MKSRPKLVFMGTPEFSLPVLKRLVADDYPLAAVYTRPDKPAGRGRSLVASPVKRFAQAAGLAVKQPDGFKKAEAVAELASLEPDVIVVYAYGLLLPQSVLDIPPKGCLNVHPSLLPKYRGAAPVAGAILAGEDYTGVSIMLLDSGMDTGPLLKQSRVSVSGRDTTGSLTPKLSGVAAGLLLELLPRWMDGEIRPRPQDDSQATYTSLFSKPEGEIDWTLPAVDIWRRVRAFDPWPGCYTTWQGRQLKILEVVPLPGAEGALPGQVVSVDDRERTFAVGTGGGLLGIVRLQLEGKKALSAADFRRGQPDIMGARFAPSEGR